MKTVWILVAAALVVGCHSDSKGSGSSSSGPSPKIDEKAKLVGTSWCTQLGSSPSGFSYRQIVLNPDGTLVDGYFQNIAADRKPFNLTSKQIGTWTLDGPKLTLNAASQKATYSKFAVEDDISGKNLKLYDSNDLFELYYSCGNAGVGSGQTGGASAPISLKSELDQGKTLTVTLVDAKLANEINNRMGSRNLITLQDGQTTIRGDDLKNWCQIASQNGFVKGGDRFDLQANDVQDKIYLTARQLSIRVSSHLGIQCRKGGMDQSEMTLADMQQILGSLIKLELE